MCSVAYLCPPLYDPMDGCPAGSSCPWSFSGKNTGVGCHFPPPEVLPNPGMEPESLVSLALEADCLSLAPPGKVL